MTFSFYAMLKVPVHQVAGHQATNGKLGPLIDDSGKFYKPLQRDDRGARELAFYTSFSTNMRIPDKIRKFFPVFYGTQILEASDGSGQHLHLVLEDLVSGRDHPSIMDLKIGSRTWYPEAPEGYIQKCLKKDRNSTSVSLGFRICGFQLYRDTELGYHKPEKKLVQTYSADDVRSVLRFFVSSNLHSDSAPDPDCSLAQKVYGGSAGILGQLVELQEWFEYQTSYHFNSCSILILYDKESVLKGKSVQAEVKLVDFAHVLEGKGVIDHNFLGGLSSLINFISNIVSSLDDYSIKSPEENGKSSFDENGKFTSENDGKNNFCLENGNTE